MTASARATIRVMAKAADRLRGGSLWVYRNEILRAEGVEPGAEVLLEDPRGRCLGSGYWNPKSVLAARVVDRSGAVLDRAFWRDRIAQALEHRRRFGWADRGAYRVVSSEGDLLPGLTVDRYGRAAVVQIGTLGLERRRGDLLDAVRSVLEPEVLVDRSDGEGRLREGLAPRVEVLEGRLEGLWPIELDGLRFEVDLLAGHKTGFYLDQAPARRIVRALARGRRVFDGFAYTGAFACYALAGGARAVLAIESARRLLPQIEAHARANGAGDRLRARAGDVVEELKVLRRGDERFDLVILDPPPFARRRAALAGALLGYRNLHRLAFEILAPGGVLVTSSCSQLVAPEAFFDLVRQAAVHCQSDVHLIDSPAQPVDHPVLLAMPETRYLKVLVLERV